jgi:hypothetical protein
MFFHIWSNDSRFSYCLIVVTRSEVSRLKKRVNDKKNKRVFSLQPVLKDLRCLNALSVAKKNCFPLCVDTVVTRSALSTICLRAITAT